MCHPCGRLSCDVSRQMKRKAEMSPLKKAKRQESCSRARLTYMSPESQEQRKNNQQNDRISGRCRVLKELHETHPGISKMKHHSRSNQWWPGLDADITDIVQKCETCEVNRPNPLKAPLHPWAFPARPWAGVHIDHAGPFCGKLFLIVIDANSKWMDVHIVPSTASEVTIAK
ncbi:PREDICTED: uncharacterized protein K02A2.6-like [Amphimedon queenslandica]|uniref:Integrase zinc-binding domain-containing protein n=1 Tax=Amphimedon queenslandica TaxID=400682 RepID=A0AAN0IVR6_AMPQE|nr:PREDICTED: uncharacterized protein K02A2.6-like [Amphimedon queenslandica]|eukprot:XP_019848905.1 PREDICTED: uncharacterized protein K02A2.6-like [Amphimedon queenslandica]